MSEALTGATALALVIPGLLYVFGWFYFSGYIGGIDVPFQTVNPSADTILHLGVGPLMIVFLGGIFASGLVLLGFHYLVWKGKAVLDLRMFSAIAIIAMIVSGLPYAHGAGMADASKIKAQNASTWVVGMDGQMLNVTGRVFLEDGERIYLKDDDGRYFVVREDAIAFYRYDRVGLP